MNNQITFNLNDTVSGQLTSYGWHVLVHYFLTQGRCNDQDMKVFGKPDATGFYCPESRKDDRLKSIDYIRLYYQVPEQDNPRLIRANMWFWMTVFGECMFVGNPSTVTVDNKLTLHI